jgi:hypothetical protein
MQSTNLLPVATSSLLKNSADFAPCERKEPVSPPSGINCSLPRGPTSQSCAAVRVQDLFQLTVSTVFRRRVLLAAIILFAPTLAAADESISGQWRAEPGHGVIIVMDVLTDGHWASQTVQDDKVVAEMAGTYEQKQTNQTSGSFVFTPVRSKVSQEHGAASVEADKYTLESGAKVLRLVTKENEEMVFRKQPYAK